LGSHRQRTSEDLLVHPLKERTVELHQFLTGDVGKHRAPLPFNHQVPHGRYGRLTTALIGNLSVIRDKVKLPAAVTEATLLDFMAAHGELSLLGYRRARLYRAREM
jgi:hypothetical protein